jgi:carotenoid cleavage dioxygenase-like enzyme
MATSELLVIDAATFDPEPVAPIVLPQRKLTGFHGCWVPSAAR